MQENRPLPQNNPAHLSSGLPASKVSRPIKMTFLEILFAQDLHMRIYSKKELLQLKENADIYSVLNNVCSDFSETFTSICLL